MTMQNNEEKTIRTAAYVRVSTMQEEQEGSYDIQAEYFTEKIKNNPGMTLVGIYGDRGKSGLKTKGRDGLARLLADCEAGKIDLILTKSISRFSRNMADCAEIIRNLRSIGVNIFFEKENLNSKDAKCDLILNIFAAMAQDESHSISENIKLSYRARYKRGEYNLGSNHILGYDTVNGKLTPNEDAWIVKRMYELFLAGKTYAEIAESIYRDGGDSMRKCGHFSILVITYILKNETYVGDKLLYKKPPRDFLSKKRLKDSEYESYFSQMNTSRLLIERLGTQFRKFINSGKH